MRPYILQHGYETSYTCLARRAAKSNNIWNRLVRRGSIMRRVCVYGALQLAFTVICCSVFLPTYFYYWAAITYQVGRQEKGRQREGGSTGGRQRERGRAWHDGGNCVRMQSCVCVRISGMPALCIMGGLGCWLMSVSF